MQEAVRVCNRNFRRFSPAGSASIWPGSGSSAIQSANSKTFTLTATATAAAGYRLAGWSGDIVGTNRLVSILVASNTLFSALFVPVLDAISNLAVGGGPALSRGNM